MQKLTLIVPFEVPEGQEREMRQQWHGIGGQLKHAPGFLSIRLYEVDSEVEAHLKRELSFRWLEERPAGKARFRFVVIAEWASLAQYEAAIRSSLPGRSLPFPSYLAYYHLAIGSSRPETPSNEQSFTFIVPFEVPEGQEEEMLQQFREIVEGMGRPEGSFGPGLYERDSEAEAHLRGLLSARIGEERLSKTRFRFVNVARWASLTHYETVIRSRSQAKPISFPSHGAYYRVVDEFIAPNI
ncbi:MAG TPA: hypothetical protein VGN34_34805 [Ktedonobacteraceae bacterium]|jgi:heme-degrading monooxygenase HmoA